MSLSENAVMRDSETLKTEALIILKRLQEIHEILHARKDNIIAPVYNEAEDVIRRIRDILLI